MPSAEEKILQEIRERFSKFTQKLNPIVDIGSDSFALKFSGNLVVSSDSQIEGTHFTFDILTPEEVGERAVRVALSDIFTSGATPIFIFSNISCSSLKKIRGILRGIEKACSEFGVVPAGGDISFSQTTVVSIFAVGKGRKILSRKGAKSGDFLFVSGPLGSSTLMFHISQKVGRKKAQKLSPELWEKFVRPPVRGDIAQQLPKVASATCDISDGLFKSVKIISQENNLWAKIYVERIPTDKNFAVLCDKFGLDPDSLSLSLGPE